MFKGLNQGAHENVRISWCRRHSCVVAKSNQFRLGLPLNKIMLIWGTPNTSIRKTRFPGNKSEMSPEQPKDPLLSICKKKAMRVERGWRGERASSQIAEEMGNETGGGGGDANANREKSGIGLQHFAVCTQPEM